MFIVDKAWFNEFLTRGALERISRTDCVKVSGFSSAANKKTAGLIEKETYERRTLNIERPIWMTLRFIVFVN